MQARRVTVEDGAGVTADDDVEVGVGVVAAIDDVAGLDEQAVAVNSAITETRAAIHRFRKDSVFILYS